MDFGELLEQLCETPAEPCSATNEEYIAAINRRRNEDAENDDDNDETIDMSFVYDIARTAGVTPEQLADILEAEDNWVSIPTKEGVDRASEIQKLLLWVFSKTDTKVETNLGAYRKAGTVTITGDCMYFNKTGIKVLREVLKRTNGLSVSISNKGNAFADFEIKY